MAERLQLQSEERDFFSLLARAVFTNPFSDERAEIDAQISGVSKQETHGERTKQVSHVVDGYMGRFEAAGRANYKLFGPEDEQILSYAFLFEVYHKFKDAFDDLILEQVEAGDLPCPVPFAADALALLRQRGFDPPLARRHFAMFYQIRRAFFFIDGALVGESPCMKQLRLDLWNNIFTSDIRWYDRYLWNRMEDFSTLLLGETGTGKGSAAGAIGRSGFIPFDEKAGRFTESFTRAFVSLNLSQFPETLIESELFGHKKGAFTGAVEDHQGVFAKCSPHGSIFLDEIGEVSIPVQIKLLQVLQERVFSAVGSHDKTRFRGRVVAATNKSVDELRSRGDFRDDFFYRLCSDVIIVPPLRQRLAEDRGELVRLLDHMIHRLLGEGSDEIVAMTQQAIEQQLGGDYPWPGNVRELEQCTRRILLKRSYEGDRTALGSDARGRLLDDIDTERLNAADLLKAYCALLHERHGTYESVARITELDRRTVKKYVLEWLREHGEDGAGGSEST